PARYGRWDDEIQLSTQDLTCFPWDLVIIGTPPENHLDIAMNVLSREHVKAILVEKPLSPPDLDKILLFKKSIENSEAKIFIGYNHTLTKNTQVMTELITEKYFGAVKSINVFFKEHWRGIFAAHPWLSGPKESYLGNISLGGGAICEHSHGINLFQYISNITKNGRISQVSASASMVKNNGLHYDELAEMDVVTESGLKGHIQQDVITYPAIKKAMIQFDNAHIDYFINKADGVDNVTYTLDKTEYICDISKTRPDDFYNEIRHIQDILKGDLLYDKSPISIEHGINTMLVICAVFRSIAKRRAVKINYDEMDGKRALTLID
ncbi:Gfo/Idh/MocA family protein, partial [Candidatus Omnitrophota bacterium]